MVEKIKNNGHRAPARWYVRQACESHPWYFCVCLRQECPPSPSPPVFSSRSQEKASQAPDDPLLPLSVHHYGRNKEGIPEFCVLLAEHHSDLISSLIVSPPLTALSSSQHASYPVHISHPEFQARLHPQDSNSCSTLWTVREHPPHLSLSILLPCFIFLHSTCHHLKQYLLTCLFLPSRL